MRGTDDLARKFEKKYGEAMGLTTNYGHLIHFPKSKNGATFVIYSNGEAKRVHGYEKRLLLSLLEAVAAGRVKGLPKVFDN